MLDYLEELAKKTDFKNAKQTFAAFSSSNKPFLEKYKTDEEKEIAIKKHQSIADLIIKNMPVAHMKKSIDVD